MAVLSPLESPTLKSPIAKLLQQIRAEYLEMPGLKLTAPQARRLWGPDCAMCDAVLAALVDATFLSRTRQGLFIMAATPCSEHASHAFEHGKRVHECSCACELTSLPVIEAGTKSAPEQLVGVGDFERPTTAGSRTRTSMRREITESRYGRD